VCDCNMCIAMHAAAELLQATRDSFILAAHALTEQCNVLWV
jgi:hypothetical protein